MGFFLNKYFFYILSVLNQWKIHYAWLFILLMACSHTQQTAKVQLPQLIPQGIKNTYKDEIYKDSRTSHLMQPLVTEKFVFQGNARDGLVAYDKKTQRQLWRKDIEGGVQGAVFHNGYLYFGGGDGQLYCLEAINGREVWSYHLRVEVLQAPTFHNGILYVVTANNTAYAFIARTGEQKWVYARKGTFPSLNIYGGSQPIIYRDRVLLAFSDGSVVSVSQVQGQVVWEKSFALYSRFKNLYIGLNEGMLYASSYEQDMYALDPQTGKEFWKIAQKGGPSHPTAYQNNIFFSTSQGEVVSANKSTGKVQWTYSLKNSIGTKPMVFQNTVYVGQSHGPLLGLDKSSGQVQVQYDKVKGTLAPVNVADQKVYLMSNEGQLHIIRIK